MSPNNTIIKSCIHHIKTQFILTNRESNPFVIFIEEGFCIYLHAWKPWPPPIIWTCKVRNVETQNKAAFAHLVRRFLQSLETLWSGILRQKYLRHWKFQEVEARPKDSSIWKGMPKHKNTILNNLHWVVGDGKRINALDDEWVPMYGTLRGHLDPVKGLTAILQELSRPPDAALMVSNLIDLIVSPPRWDFRKLESLWNHEIVDAIRQLSLGQEDIRC